MAIIGLVLGLGFLVLAVVSTVSRVTLSVFHPWLGRQIRQRENPRTFVAVVFGYWLVGAAATLLATVSLASGR